MTDYTKATGSSGTMMIRDTGSVVEFWLKAGSSTFANQLPWGYTVNGVTDNTNEFRFQSGGSWQKLGAWSVSTTQTVTFKIFDSGTGGLGGPTTFNQPINRSSVPDPPTVLSLSYITSTSATVTFSVAGSNGSPIDQKQVGWGTSSTFIQHAIDSDGSTNIGGLVPGTLYYFWARTHNALGWSPWGARRSATTLRVPDAPSTVVLTNVGQVSVDAQFTDNANGGISVFAREIGYGTSPTAPNNTVPSDGSTTVTGLIPGTKYYFWARVQNSVGWSPYSRIAASATTIGGCLVKVGLVYKQAIPYVNVAGVWKIARPWSRLYGLWKEAS